MFEPRLYVPELAGQCEFTNSDIPTDTIDMKDGRYPNMVMVPMKDWELVFWKFAQCEKWK